MRLCPDITLALVSIDLFLPEIDVWINKVFVTFSLFIRICCAGVSIYLALGWLKDAEDIKLRS
jgi:hypothetical protein